MMKLFGYYLLVTFFLLGETSISAQSYLYISPKNNSILVSLSTNIILKSSDYIDPSSLSQNEFIVEGSISGIHSGVVKLSDDNKTILFLPTVPFSANENVNVVVSQGIKTIDGELLPKVTINFKTTPLSHPIDFKTIFPSENETLNSSNDVTTLNKSSNSVLRTDSLPSNFPVITVDTSNNPAPGQIFMTNQLASNLNKTIGNYLMILNNDGSVANYKELPSPANVFRMQPNGELSYSLRVDTYWTVLDTSLTPVDSFACGNGYTADKHDFYLLPNGHGLLFAYDPEPVDMSKVVPGGNPNAIVTGVVIQEVDASKDVVFQWRSWDYLPITASYQDLTAKNIDLIHMNAITVDHDGNIVVSMRHLSSIMKINRETGKIMWILGGKLNQFTFINEHAENAPTYFSYQHDVSVLPNGDITLFDNGNQHLPTPYSRAVEYKLDVQNKTATLVWEYRHNPDIWTRAMGTVERLPNGNTMVGWGIASGPGIPTFTEVHPDNSVALEMSLPQGQISHRTYKYPWVSQKAEASVNLEILQGNTYNFTFDKDTTGVKITFNKLINSPYIFFTVTRYSYAPLNPEFTTTAPNMYSNYFNIEGSSYTGDVDVNLKYYPAVLNPKETIVYAKSDSNSTFVPLPTSYDSVKNELTFTTSISGEFAFGIPQTIDSAYAPVPITPKDSDIVNGLKPVKLVWGTKGIVQSYHLQVSTNASFSNLVVDNSNLKSTLFTINSVTNNSTYYWRVNNTNAAGTSDWSKVERFMTESPFIKVLYPNGGVELNNDSTYVIRWQSNISDSVNVDLVKDNTVVSVIGDSIISGTNAISWQVPSTIQTDSTYKIRITSIKDPSITDQSDTTFTIGNGVTGVKDLSNKIKSYQLYQNYPNPFNPSTVIKYSIPLAGNVNISIYNAIGQKVETLVNEYQNKGIYEINWNASDLSSGVYFCSIRAKSQSGGKDFYSVKKMILLK